MTDEEFYEQSLNTLRTAEQYLLEIIAGYREETHWTEQGLCSLS